MKHICRHCNDPFESPHRRAKFCSRDCADKGKYRPVKDRVCRLCEKPLESPGQIKLWYCSKECRDSDPNRIVINGLVHTICLQCGNAFTHERWRTRDYCSTECADEACRTVTMIKAECEKCHILFEHRSNQPRRFCSKECWYEYGVGKNNPCWNSIEVKCEHCERLFHRERKHAENHHLNFCSIQCRADYFSSRIVGKKHHLYKGEHIHYRGPNWIKQRNKARKRDNYKCHCCGKSEKQLGYTLHVHHIVAFSEFGYIRDVNDHYKAANALTNLVCVCRQCHMPVEYGKLPIQPYLI